MVVLDGERYAQCLASDDPVMQDVIENYRLWSPHNEESDPDQHPSVLFDTVAIYLAFTTEFIKMEKFGMSVDNKGYTIKDDNGRPTGVAIDWEDFDAYMDFLTERLLAPVCR